jgi:hypothetical protein
VININIVSNTKYLCKANNYRLFIEVKRTVPRGTIEKRDAIILVF